MQFNFYFTATSILRPKYFTLTDCNKEVLYWKYITDHMAGYLELANSRKLSAFNSYLSDTVFVTQV